VLGRAEIIRAIRIRKLLDQAASETGPAAATFTDAARRLAVGYPRGPRLMYDGKPVLR
jgi:hypothetical protein